MNEYKTLLQLLNNNADKSEVYNELMQKETKVLDIISRISNQASDESKSSSLFHNLTVYDIIAKFANTWRNIFTELFIEANYKETSRILMHGDRKIYVGIMLMIFAFIVFFVKST
jgi:hypothetical protein